MRSTMLAGLFAAAFAWSAGSVQAAAPPPTALRAVVIVPPVPQTWVVSAYNNSGIQEMGELTPAGQTGPNYIDLIGFSVTPMPPQVTLQDVLTAARGSLSTRCPQPALREVATPTMPTGWGELLTYCLTPDAAGVRLEANAMAFQVRDGFMFTVWRAHRESAAHFPDFLKTRLGRKDALTVADGGGWRYDDAALDRVSGALAASLYADVAKTEICDLAVGEICPSLRRADGPDSDTIAFLKIEGTRERTMRQSLTDAQSGPAGDLARQTLAALKPKDADKPFETLQALSLLDHDWSSGDGIKAALVQPIVGARSGGATLVAVDREPKADLATRGRMQAYVVMLSRILWAAGVTPQRETLVLTPPKP